MIEDYSKPMKVAAFEGTVLIEGPGATCGAFTPEAAEQSARRLLEAAHTAREWNNLALLRPDG